LTSYLLSGNSESCTFHHLLKKDHAEQEFMENWDVPSHVQAAEEGTDPSLVMLQSNGENIVMWEERLHTYLEATHGVIGTFKLRGKYPERQFPTGAEIANKYEIDEDDAKAMLKTSYRRFKQCHAITRKVEALPRLLAKLP
jgi:hypothetical protein